MTLFTFNFPLYTITMQSLEKVYLRLHESKMKKREITKMIRDELTQDTRYRELTEEMKKLRDERKSIENEIKSHTASPQELDELKIEIQTDQELLADIALNMFTDKQAVEILDEYDQRWVPLFSVKFVKD